MLLLPLICISHFYCLQKCIKQSRLNSSVPLLHVFIPLKILSYYLATARPCPSALLNFKDAITALELMERAIKETKDRKSVCHFDGDFVCNCYVIPFHCLNLFSHPRTGPETVHSVEQNLIGFNKDNAPLRSTRQSLALINATLTLHSSYLLVFCNLPSPGPGPLGQEFCQPLLSGLRVPNAGDLPGIELEWPRLSTYSDTEVSAPCASGSSFSLFWDSSAVLHYLPPSQELAGEQCPPQNFMCPDVWSWHHRPDLTVL